MPSTATNSKDPSKHLRETTDVEREMIEFFVHLAQSVGFARSVGEIYGILFSSEKPLCLDDLITRLGISKGSASQGIKLLRSYNAVKAVYIPGDRRDFFTAEISLKNLAAGFINERLNHRISDGKQRLEHMQKLIEEQGDKGSFIDKRVDSLQSWNKKAATFLPLLERFLGTN